MVQADLRPTLSLGEQFRRVRALTEELAAPLSPEDQTAQSMPDVSPTKWHRAHTSWFFETFVLAPGGRYKLYDEQYAFLFNSYYETVGPFFPRDRRGVITRPGAADISRYRRYVDQAMGELLDQPLAPEVESVVELGCHHEQQHQELILMDIKHVLWMNPARPAYRPTGAVRSKVIDGWLSHEGGIVEIGHPGTGFGFDNEFPRHVLYLEPFEIASWLVTNGDWLSFMDDGGYRRPELWLSEGWATVRDQEWSAPLYWERDGGAYRTFTLGGSHPLDLAAPVCHVSYFEADAYARWAGARLPSEAEWEAVAGSAPVSGEFLDLDVLQPVSTSSSMYGGVWQWTSSSYTAYPRYQPGPGALGEYNGKFMSNQYVLRGGSAVTPPGHTRATYRNYFPARARWAFSGLRLARHT
jgi:ergothioneine biosynthesis protein EgtB